MFYNNFCLKSNKEISMTVCVYTRVVPEYRNKFYFAHLMMFNFAETFTVS